MSFQVLTNVLHSKHFLHCWPAVEVILSVKFTIRFDLNTQCRKEFAKYFDCKSGILSGKEKKKVKSKSIWPQKVASKGQSSRVPNKRQVSEYWLVPILENRKSWAFKYSKYRSQNSVCPRETPEGSGRSK